MWIGSRSFYVDIETLKGRLMKLDPNMFQKYLVKIKGDAGTYKVFGVDSLNCRLYVLRSCGYEWVNFDKIKDIALVDSYTDPEISES